MEPEVKPPFLAFACGDAGILAEVTWTTWTTKRAVGRGEVQINTCQPSCATGTREPYAASFTAQRPLSEGRFVYFRDLVIRFAGERPGSRSVVVCPLSTPSFEGGCVNEFLD